MISPGSMPYIPRMSSTCPRKVRCVQTALGTPVLPEVKRMAATSSSAVDRVHARDLGEVGRAPAALHLSEGDARPTGLCARRSRGA